MSESNKTINDMLRRAWDGGTTFVASQRNKTLNDDIRSKANIGIAVGGEKRQEAPQDATATTDTAKGAATQPEQPKAPTGNAGNGAYVATSKPQPTMNDLFRSAWRGKRSGVINRYSETGREIQ